MHAPGSHAELPSDPTKPKAHLATAQQDRPAQVVSVWLNAEGDDIPVKTEHSRVVIRNMRRTPRAPLLMVDPPEALRSMQLQDKMAGSTENGAFAHTESLLAAHRGQGWTPTSVIIRIRPQLDSIS